MSVRLPAICALLWALHLASPVEAQDRAPVRLQVEPESGQLQMQLGEVFDDGRLRQAINRGLPLRISVEVELWRDAFFDSEAASSEWRASVVWDPVVQLYRVRVGQAEAVEVPTLAVASGVLQNGFELPIGPDGPGRYYYLATVEMETLSLSDLEELQRWLGGELAPAVRGEGDVDGAVARGMRRLLVRALGLPTRRLRLRSPTFEVGGRDPGSTETGGAEEDALDVSDAPRDPSGSGPGEHVWPGRTAPREYR